MKKKTLVIINAIVSVVLIALSVFLFIKAHNYRILEMNTQIAQFGFYKSDITLLVDNYYKKVWSAIGSAFGAAFGMCVWLDFLFFC